MAAIVAEATDRSRKGAILTAAEPIFVRYGYRKTSMDDVAKAADVSRQGLYVHFASKEDLFREMIVQSLGLHLHKVRAILSDEARPIGEQLLAALDEWYGNRDRLGSDSDLIQTSMQIAGGIIRDHYGQLQTEIGRAIEKSELMPFYEARGISATDIADTLMATARGINEAASDETFLARAGVAIAILVAPCSPAAAR